MVVGCQRYAPAAFTPRKYSWYSFVLVAASTTMAVVRLKEFYVNEKSSDTSLYYSTLATVLPRSPGFTIEIIQNLTSYLTEKGGVMCCVLSILKQCYGKATVLSFLHSFIHSFISIQP